MEKIRLLLVDDEVDYLLALSRRLRKRGLEADQAKSGEEALYILQHRPADVIVMDVRMPGMSGLELLARVRGKYPQTEVILLTGQASVLDGVEGIKAGAFDYLSKPVEIDHLAGKIQQAWDKINRAAEKRKEAEFRARLERQMMTTERLASLGTLAAGVAHEINNPLAVINEAAGWMQLLLKRPELEGMPLKADFAHALEKIVAGVSRAKGITHQLLGFVRDDQTLLAEVDLEELVDDTLEFVRKTADKKQVDVRRQVDSGITRVWLDPNAFRQILVNLVNNAIQATDPGGKIDIRLGESGGLIELTVKDTGSGIPRENLARIFEPFFSTKPQGEGTGLGLFVTRGIAEKMGGRIDVESRPGHGALFRVTLPRVAPGEKPETPVSADLLGKLKHRFGKTPPPREGEPE